MKGQEVTPSRALREAFEDAVLFGPRAAEVRDLKRRLAQVEQERDEMRAAFRALLLHASFGGDHEALDRALGQVREVVERTATQEVGRS